MSEEIPTKVRKDICSIATGLTSWIVFQRRAARWSIFRDERFVYAPVLELAQSLGWKVHLEHPHSSLPKKEIDFALTNSNEVILIELKLVRKKHRPPEGSKRAPIDVKNDFEKLTTYKEKYGKPVYRFLLIAGDIVAIRKNKWKPREVYKCIQKLYALSRTKQQNGLGRDIKYCSGVGWFTSYRSAATRYGVFILEFKPISP